MHVALSHITPWNAKGEGQAAVDQAQEMERILAAEKPNTRELAKLVATLSVPTIMAEVCNTAMEYIDTAMVGSLGAQASAAIGLVASSTWLIGGICMGLSVGFTVQIAQFIGAGRNAEARNVLRQSLVVLALFSLVLGGAGVALSGHLPYWLGGEPDVAADAASYFLIFSLAFSCACAWARCNAPATRARPARSACSCASSTWYSTSSSSSPTGA